VGQEQNASTPLSSSSSDGLTLRDRDTQSARCSSAIATRTTDCSTPAVPETGMPIEMLAILHERLKPLVIQRMALALAPPRQDPLWWTAGAVQGALGPTGVCRRDHLSQLAREWASGSHRRRWIARGQAGARSSARSAWSSRYSLSVSIPSSCCAHHARPSTRPNNHAGPARRAHRLIVSGWHGQVRAE
jgi:hypothetical protein